MTYLILCAISLTIFKFCDMIAKGFPANSESSGEARIAGLKLALFGSFMYGLGIVFAGLFVASYF